MIKHLLSTLLILFGLQVFAGGGITGSNLSCGISSSQSLSNSGFSGSNATSATGSCGQCCYQGADLDSDGDADVNFSVENAQWYQYCNPSGTASLTIDFIVDETNNDCNLQGAVFVTAGTSSAGATDALDIDCSNQEYAQYGSGVSGNADGFSFTGITIPPGGCAFLMVDGYGGATCGAFTVNVVCPPLCTNPTSFTAGPDQAICEGSSILLNSTVSGGTTTAPGLSYSWTPTTGLSCTTCADPTASPTATTTYTMTACNGGPGFCCVTDQVVVTVTPNFVANAGADITACAPSTVTIGGSPTGPTGSTYAWVVSGTNNTGIAISGSTTVANPTVTISSGATGSETYQVTVTNGPCIRTDLVTVTVGPLAVNAGLDQSICLGSTVSIGGAPTAPAGSTYSWSPSTGLSSSTAANPIFTAGSTTTFTVTATLGTCSNTDQVIVTVNPLPATPTATASINPICAGQSVTLTAAGGAGTGTYSWWTASTGGTNLGSANTLTVNPTVTTTYYVQSTDATTGCISARGSITVTVNPTPVANAGTDQTLCVGEVATLAGTLTNAGSCSPIQTWSIVSGTGSFSNVNLLTSTFTPTSSGTITLQLTPCSPGGCTPVSDQVILTVSPSPVVTASVVTNPICVGLITDLVGTVTGGNPFDPDTTYQTFTSGAGPISIPDNNTSGVSIPISVTGVPNSTTGTTTISGVTINVDHDRIGQVEVWLCPPGVTPTPTTFPGCIQLFNNHGGAGDDLVNTTFTDGSAVDITAGAPPYSGSFNATGTGLLNGASYPTNGTWTVVVIDNVGTQNTVGTAGQMSITFGTPVPVDPYTYSWSPSTNLSSTNTESTSLSTSGLTAPTTLNYTLTATDENGCTGSASVTVDVIGPPTATAGSDQNVCATSTNLAGNNPGAGTTGQWTVVSGTGTFTDATLYNTTVSGLGSGINVFQWTLTNSCGSAFDQVSIISSTPQSISPASTNPTLCVNTALSPSITFTTTGATGIGSITGLPAGVSASWFGNTLTISGTPTASGTFNYSIPLTGGCGALNATGTITVVDVPVITLTPDDPNTCNATDGSILVSGTGSGTITWTGPTSGSASSSLNYTIPTLGAGTYSVYFTNASGCQSATVQTSLANPGAPQINIISDVSNCGTSYTLPAVPFVPGTENNPQYYTGPNGTGTVVAVGTVYNAPTNLTLYAYDVNGACSDEEPFVITINAIPSVNPLTAVQGCPGSSIDPTDFSSTPAGATFSWTNDNIAVGIPSLGNGQIATYNAPANATNANVVGTVSVTPILNGCTGSTSTFTITILPTPTINTISDVSGCPESSADPADFVSVPAGATFTWSNSNATIGLGASGNGQITPFNLATNNTASAITGTISATATLNGCTSAPLTFTISINPTPVITLTPTDPSSCNGTDGSVLVNTGAPGSVSWSGTSTGTSGPMNANYSITNLGAGAYDVTFTNSSTGCQSTVVSTTLLNPGAPIINPIADVTQCGGSYTLPAITGTSLINAQYYTQPNGGGGIVSEGTLFEPDTVITLYAYDANGLCSATESFTISIYTLPTATISGGSTYCEGDNVLDISATINFGVSNYTLNYTLNGVAQTQSGSTTSLSLGNTAGTYVLLSISDANCTNSNLSSTQTIVINAIPSAPTAGADTLYCDNESPVPLFAQGSSSFTWYSDQNLTNEIGTNSSLIPSMNVGTTSYYVTETINGCEGPASVVVVSVEECGIIVPTAFTPDGDQTNDTWTLLNIDQVYPKNVVSIYNRWGNLIYQSKEGQYETKPWDGKYNDENMPVGSYYFIIEFNDNFTENKAGIVTLIK